LDNGADYQNGIDGESYFDWATRNGYDGVINSLVKRGVEFNKKDPRDIY